MWCGVTDAEPGFALEFFGVTAVPRTTFVSSRARQGKARQGEAIN